MGWPSVRKPRHNYMAPPGKAIHAGASCIAASIWLPSRPRALRGTPAGVNSPCSDAHLVVGHVGRFCEPKNHEFLLEVFAAASRRCEALRLLLVGDGPLRPAMEKQARALGVAERVIFAGLRRDVPWLMRDVFDLFCLPSRHEGLPLVLMEAQAAGCQVLISDVITEEADILAEQMHRLPLAAGVTRWADTLLALAALPRASGALERVGQSAFNITHSIAALQAFYLAAIQQEKEPAYAGD